MLGSFDRLSIRPFKLFGLLLWLFWLFPKDQDYKKTLKTLAFCLPQNCIVSTRAARAVTRNATGGAAVSTRNATNMVLVVAAMDAEFGTPCRVANQARATAIISPENAVQRAREARRGALVHCVDKTQGEEDVEDGRSKGVASPNGRGEGPSQRARASVRRRITSVQRTRASYRGQTTGRAGKAPEEPDDLVGVAVARASSMRAEGPRQQARLNTRGWGTRGGRRVSGRLRRKTSPLWSGGTKPPGKDGRAQPWHG